MVLMTKKNKHIKNRKIYDKVRPYVYLSPALISIFVLAFLPIVYTIYIAFTNYNLNHLDDFHLIGFGNFISIFNGPFKSIFFPVFGWTVIFAVVGTFGSFAMGLILAMLLNNPNMKEASIYKGILILPWALPGTIATLAWVGLLDMNYGGINVLLKSLHIINTGIPWLIDPFWARVGVLIATFWLGFPYMMNVCIGALSSIPNIFYEAADIDGATKFQKFTKITLPSITSASLPLLISSFSYNFSNLSAAYLITGGLPARTTTQFAGYTDILASTIYKLSITNNRYDMAAAFSIILFLIIGTISFVNFKLSGAFKEVD
ncbi:carbohydrate ABC transporter permease [Clostridium estertheticum]|uniref:carbohydrate ABC transporter permease n=1 Tax=Clostridium estertheticum TaxID=238834 RepID=UPI0035C83FFC